MCPTTPEDAIAVKTARDFRCISGSLCRDIGGGKERPDEKVSRERVGVSISGNILRYIKSSSSFRPPTLPFPLLIYQTLKITSSKPSSLPANPIPGSSVPEFE
jgi:hypothetical protein